MGCWHERARRPSNVNAGFNFATNQMCILLVGASTITRLVVCGLSVTDETDNSTTEKWTNLTHNDDSLNCYGFNGFLSLHLFGIDTLFWVGAHTWRVRRTTTSSPNPQHQTNPARSNTEPKRNQNNPKTKQHGCNTHTTTTHRRTSQQQQTSGGATHQTTWCGIYI